MTTQITRIVPLLVAFLLSSSAAFAEDAGQADLDKAVDAKLDAQSIDDLGGVIDLCQSALKKGLNEDNSAFAKQLLGSTLVQRGEAYAQIALGAPPTDPRVRRVREMALEDLQQALEATPDQPSAHLLIGRLEAMPGGDPKRARESLDEAVRLNKENPNNLAEALMARAPLLEDPEAQLADYGRVLELDPDNADALRERGRVHLASGDAEAALQDFDAALAADADDVTAQFLRSQVLFSQQKFDEALASLNDVIDKAPSAAPALISRARIHTLKSDSQSAIADLDKALLLAPGDVIALWLRASNHAQLGETEKALADLDQALQMDAEFSPALRTRAALLAGTGKAEAAIEDLEKANVSNPQDAETLLQLGMLYLANKNHQKAIERYTSALELAADNPLLLRSRADAYLGVGRQKEALADYEKALAAAPEDSGILNNLAWLLATSPDDSLRDAKRSLKLATQACEITEYRQAHILSTLAAAYAESGDFESAVKWSKKAVEISDESLRDALAKELKSYEEGKPWRELQTEGENLIDEPEAE